jgi:PKD repeat protein
MKKIFFIAGAILVLATFQFGQNLGNDKLLVHHTGGIRWSQCAFTPDGVLWVVYEEDADRGHPIWVVSYDGTTISTPFNVTGSLDIRGERPGISAGPKGQVVVTWGVLADSTVFMRVRDAKTKTWLPIETVKIGYGADEPSSAVDSEGNIHVAWFDLMGSRAYARSKIGGVWGESTKLTIGGGKDITVAVGSNGTAWTAWKEKVGSNYKNYYSSRTKTTTWTTPAVLTSGGGSSAHPHVTVGPDNVAVVAWGDIDQALENGGEMRVMKIQSNAAREIAIPFYMQHYPRIVVDKDGVIHLVCQIGGGDFGDGLRYTNNKGGTWKEPQTIPASMDKIVGIATDPFGNVAACQSSFNSNGGSDVWVYSLSPVVSIPYPVADFSYSPQSGYPPLSVNFSAVRQTGPNGQEVNYDWVFGDGSTASGRMVTHVFNTPGTIQVRLTIIDNIGRSDSIIKTVEVNKTNPLPPTNLSATIGMSRFWKNPEIAYNLFWSVNPANVPEHVAGYAIYVKENNGAYTRLLTVSPGTLSASFKFTDLKKKRSFAVSTLGLGDTESDKVYFQ